MSLDEASAALVAQFTAAGAPPIRTLSPVQARATVGVTVLGPVPTVEMAAVGEHRIPVEGGSIAARTLVPGEEVDGVLVYLHGGGWVLGAIDHFDLHARTVAAATNCAVVLVDYRLAPEHPFPTAVEDAYAATRWAEARLVELAGRRVPLAVGGDSAGGNLAAAVALLARERSGPSIDLQVLAYPVLDAEFTTASYLAAENNLIVDRDLMMWFWDHYCPDPATRRSPHAAPLRERDLGGLPPAVVITAEHDVLRDEGEAYADRLREAGVPVDFRRFAGQIHGFFTIIGLPGNDAAVEFVGDAVRRRFGVGCTRSASSA
ncbi:alpha/beta hydrolase [Pseudonocardia halophobica]|uniref:Acetylhydrolase n=1 Tax=Pseudonocardia halophobica TaxID=29401 RepID=A0A9W6L0F7_9PSEU|nr:alpha/beta hydrolase [Pseudonocardia halophobica]GLL10515.1 acetylhydrolase [Pseudonocardia halophobica]